MSTYHLLTEEASSPKLSHYDGEEFYGAVLYLSPADTAGFASVCPWSGDCEGPCLNTSGRGGIGNPETNKVLLCRIRRTTLYFEDRKAFLAILKKDIEKHIMRSKKRDKNPAVRLDGTSDIGLATKFCLLFPEVVFYDYTKSYKRMLQYLAGHFPANYHLTFSRDGNGNQEQCRKVLELGGNVAVVFGVKKSESLPDTYLGYSVIDGDNLNGDYRFLDPSNVVVGLRAKGKAKKDTSSFVVRS